MPFSRFFYRLKVTDTASARLIPSGSSASTISLSAQIETEAPAALTYSSSVVSRDSARIALLVVSLYELDVLASDVQNVHLMADCREKIYIIAGPEFGSMEGRIMII
jgi:hypothetical protein